MSDQQSTTLPAYLADLLHPTPMGIATLLVAWDGLSVESQIRLLMALKETHCPAYLIEKVYIRALDSDNAYIRYLAAKELHFSYGDSEEKRGLKQRIAQRIALDPHPFVRDSFLGEEKSSLFGRSIITGSNPVDFFALPHTARLACIRRLNRRGIHYCGEDSEYIAQLIAYAMDHQLRDSIVPEIELFEILSEYEGALDAGSMGALWSLISRLPETILGVVIKRLYGSNPAIPDNVLNAMTNRQLITLFGSANIGLIEIRKKFFFELAQPQLSQDDGRDGLWYAVVRHNFDLTYPEFLQILEKPVQEKMRMLSHLVLEAKDLSLCFYDAIAHVLCMQISYTEYKAIALEENLLSAGDYAQGAYAALKNKLATLQGWERKKQIWELRLYRLALNAVPWGQVVEGVQPSGVLAFLAKEIIPGDTWRTFMAFSKKWDSVVAHYLLAGGNRWRPSDVKQFKEIEKHLPPFPDRRDFDEYRDLIRQDGGSYDDCVMDYYAMQSEEDDLAENTASAKKHIDDQFEDLLSAVTDTINSLSTNDVEDRHAEVLSALTTSVQAVNALKDEHSKAMNDLKLNYERKHTEIIQYLSEISKFTDHDLTNIHNSMKEYEERQEKRSQNFLNKINEESSALRDKLKLLFAVFIIGFVVLLFMHK